LPPMMVVVMVEDSLCTGNPRESRPPASCGWTGGGGPVFVMDYEVGLGKMSFFHMALIKCESRPKDHALKNECIDFFFSFIFLSNKCSFERNQNQGWPFSCLLLSSSSLLQRRTHSKFIIATFSLPWALAFFFYCSTSYASLPSQNPLDRVSG
jgi:hypothetical protein